MESRQEASSPVSCALAFSHAARDSALAEPPLFPLWLCSHTLATAAHLSLFPHSQELPQGLGVSGRKHFPRAKLRLNLLALSAQASPGVRCGGRGRDQAPTASPRLAAPGGVHLCSTQV